MRRNWPFLVAVVIVVASGGLWIYRKVIADPDAKGIVKKAWTEGRRVPLEGRQVIRMPAPDGKIVEVEARVLASRDGQLRIEYLTRPLEGVTVWENGERTYRYNPKLKRLTVAHKRSSLDDEARRELQLLKNYNARRVGEETVAGRPTEVVALSAKSGSTCRKRVWIDPETYVILASEDYRGGDELLRSTRFTQVRYLSAGEEPDASAFRPPQELVEKYGVGLPGDTSDRFTPERLSKVIGFEIREPKWLPRGYTFEGAYQTPCLCNQRHQAARLEYSDGLNRISLFECGHPDCTSSDNCFAADGAMPLAVRYQSEPYYYLAIGDAPRGDLERMVQSAAGPAVE
jgi:outer membrane lipoprotein-sorting protein